MQALEFEARVAQDDRDRKYPNRMWGFYMSNLCLCLWIAAIIALLGVGIGALAYSSMNYGRLGDVKNKVDDMHCPTVHTFFCHTDLSSLQFAARTADNHASHPFVLKNGKLQLRSDAVNDTFVGCNAQMVGLVFSTNGIESQGRRLAESTSTSDTVAGASSDAKCTAGPAGCDIATAASGLAGAVRAIAPTNSFAQGTAKTLQTISSISGDTTLVKDVESYDWFGALASLFSFLAGTPNPPSGSG